MAAEQSLKRTAEVINQKKGESERVQAIVELQAKLVGLPPKFEPLVKPGQERYRRHSSARVCLCVHSPDPHGAPARGGPQPGGWRTTAR